MFILKNNRNWLTIQDNMRCMIDVFVKTDQFRFSRIKINLVLISKCLVHINSYALKNRNSHNIIMNVCLYLATCISLYYSVVTLLHLSVLIIKLVRSPIILQNNAFDKAYLTA